MALLNLISYQSDIDEIYLLAKDRREAKHQFLLNKHKNVWVKHWDDPKSFIKYSNYMDDMIYMKVLINTIQIKKEKYWSYLIISSLVMYLAKKKKKTLQPIVTKLFIKSGTINTCLVFIT